MNVSDSAIKALYMLAQNPQQFEHWPMIFYAMLARSMKIASHKQPGMPTYTGMYFGNMEQGGLVQFLITCEQKKAKAPKQQFALLITGKIGRPGAMQRQVKLEPNDGSDFKQIPVDQSKEYPIDTANVLTTVAALHEQKGIRYPLPAEVAAELIMRNREDAQFMDAAGGAFENVRRIFEILRNSRTSPLTMSRHIMGKAIEEAEAAQMAQ